VGRHHCWAAGPLGLGFPVSLYIVVHLYAIQSTVHSSTWYQTRLGFLLSAVLSCSRWRLSPTAAASCAAAPGRLSLPSRGRPPTRRRPKLPPPAAQRPGRPNRGEQGEIRPGEWRPTRARGHGEAPPRRAGGDRRAARVPPRPAQPLRRPDRVGRGLPLRAFPAPLLLPQARRPCSPVAQAQPPRRGCRRELACERGPGAVQPRCPRPHPRRPRPRQPWPCLGPLPRAAAGSPTLAQAQPATRTSRLRRTAPALGIRAASTLLLLPAAGHRRPGPAHLPLSPAFLRALLVTARRCAGPLPTTACSLSAGTLARDASHRAASS
jgi:hypothetical protein